MSSWFNPRVFAVATSIVVMVPLSKIEEPHQTIRRGVIACACLFTLYLLAFLLPLWKAFGLRKTLAPVVSLLAAWSAVAMAITADAWPITLDEEMTRRFNLPMMLACVAAVAAFYLFFTHTTRAYELRAALREARGEV